MHGKNKDESEIILVEFMLDLATKGKLQHGSIGIAVAAVKHSLSLNNPSIVDAINDKSVLIKKAKAAITNNESKIRISNKVQPKLGKSPMTMDMINWLRNKYWNSGPFGTSDNKMTLLSIIVGFNGLLRVSEFVDKTKSCDVTPFTGGHVHYKQSLSEKIFSTQEVREHSIPTDTIDLITIYIPYTKTNKSGAAKSCTIQRVSSEESSRLIDMMVEWASISMILDSDVFFSRYKGVSPKVTHLKLTSKMVSTMMKEAALEHGLSEKEISTHSLRHGGRTTMNNAGASEEQIKTVGAWQSGAHRIYQRPSRMDEGVLSLVCPGNKILSSKDIISTTQSSTKRFKY